MSEAALNLTSRRVIDHPVGIPEAHLCGLLPLNDASVPILSVPGEDSTLIGVGWEAIVEAAASHLDLQVNCREAFRNACST